MRLLFSVYRSGVVEELSVETVAGVGSCLLRSRDTEKAVLLCVQQL
jgi:hypothetical protein